MAHVLIARRKALGLTQAEVASRLGISQSRLSELENQPVALTVDRLLALAGVRQRHGYSDLRPAVGGFWVSTMCWMMTFGSRLQGRRRKPRCCGTRGDGAGH